MALEVERGGASGTTKVGGVLYDPTINLGHLLTFLCLMVGGMTIYFQIETQLEVHNTRIEVVEEAYDLIPDLKLIVATNAKSVDRLEAADERMTGTTRRIFDQLIQIREDIGAIKGRVLPED